MTLHAITTIIWMNTLWKKAHFIISHNRVFTAVNRRKNRRSFTGAMHNLELLVFKNQNVS